MFLISKEKYDGYEAESFYRYLTNGILYTGLNLHSLADVRTRSERMDPLPSCKTRANCACSVMKHVDLRSHRWCI